MVGWYSYNEWVLLLCLLSLLSPYTYATPRNIEAIKGVVGM